MKDDSLQIVFMLYKSRSGSTLIADRLNRHSKILVCPESKFMLTIFNFYKKSTVFNYNELSSHICSELKFQQWKIDPSTITENLSKDNPKTWYEAALTIINCYKTINKPNASVVIVKKGGWYAKRIRMLLASFNDSKAIYIIRDPRAVYYSSSTTLKSEVKKYFSKNSIVFSVCWVLFFKRMFRSVRHYPENIHIIKYEDFLNQFHTCLNGCFDFLKVESIKQSELDVFLDAKDNSILVSDKTSYLHQNVPKRFDFSRIDVWKSNLTLWESFIVEVICYFQMRRMGYV
jgi:hypothetical protein